MNMSEDAKNLVKIVMLLIVFVLLMYLVPMAP
jgi:hypothetical protein